jgi:hypothetical protein
MIRLMMLSTSPAQHPSKDNHGGHGAQGEAEPWSVPVLPACPVGFLWPKSFGAAISCGADNAPVCVNAW